MSRSLKLYLTALVTIGGLVIVVTSVVIQPDQRIAIDLSGSSAVNVALGLGFWTVVTLAASAFPVTMPRGSVVSTSIAPMVAVMYLGGPAAAAIVATLGTTELRELRGRVPWYGTLANHIGVAVPAIAGAAVIRWIGGPGAPGLHDFAATLLGGLVFHSMNITLCRHQCCSAPR